jgi:predicted kinase
LAEQLKIDVLATDAIRRDLFGRDIQPNGYNEGIYRPELRARVYEELFRRAEQCLRAGLSIVLDGTFPTVRLRLEASELAHRYAAAPLLVHCDCPPATALERLATRAATGSSLSDATTSIYDCQQAIDEPDPPILPVCRVDTTCELAEIVASVFARLQPLVYAGR